MADCECCKPTWYYVKTDQSPTLLTQFVGKHILGVGNVRRVDWYWDWETKDFQPLSEAKCIIRMLIDPSVPDSIKVTYAGQTESHELYERVENLPFTLYREMPVPTGCLNSNSVRRGSA